MYEDSICTPEFLIILMRSLNNQFETLSLYPPRRLIILLDTLTVFGLRFRVKGNDIWDSTDGDIDTGSIEGM